jgi:predicted nucleic acid-binding protein
MVFVDTCYFVAQLNERDRLHKKATATMQGLGSARLVTSEMVLAELLNYFADCGPDFRRMASNLTSKLRQLPQIRIEPQTSDLFRAAHEMYVNREDKAWSLTDCASFWIMQNQNITDAVTHDLHFRQSGFRALLLED